VRIVHWAAVSTLLIGICGLSCALAAGEAITGVPRIVVGNSQSRAKNGPELLQQTAVRTWLQQSSTTARSPRVSTSSRALPFTPSPAAHRRSAPRPILFGS